MSKPILVINYCIEGIDMKLIVKNLRELQMTIAKSEVHEDYHIFLLPTTSDSNIQVFYEKDFNEIGFDELKNLIEEKLKIFEDLTAKSVAKPKSWFK